MMRAPTSGLLRQWRCHSPSASVKERNERRGWMRRRRASRSTWAVALVRAHCSRSSASGERRAASSRSCSARGVGRRRRRRWPSPARPTTRPGGRRPTSPAGTPTGGRCRGRLRPGPRRCPCAGPAGAPPSDRPRSRHEPVSATRAAARDLTVAAIFSIRDACSTTSAAWAADSTAASKPAAYSPSDFPQLCDPHAHSRANRPERATYRGKSTPVLPELVFVSYHPPRAVVVSFDEKTSRPDRVPRVTRMATGRGNAETSGWQSRVRPCAGPATSTRPSEPGHDRKRWAATGLPTHSGSARGGPLPRRPSTH